jgi:hypothetical protein
VSEDIKQTILDAEEAIRELAARSSSAATSASALTEAREALDASRTQSEALLERLQALEQQLHQGALDRDAALAELIDAVQKSTTQAFSALEARGRSLEEALLRRGTTLEDESRRAAEEILASARRALEDGATAVRQAELAFGDHAELLKRYAEGYRTSFVAAANEGMQTVTARAEDAAKASAEIIRQLSEATQPAIKSFSAAEGTVTAASTAIAEATKTLADAARTSMASVAKLNETTPSIFTALNRASETVVTATASMSAASRTLLARAADKSAAEAIGRLQRGQRWLILICLLQFMAMVGLALVIKRP